MNKKISVVIPVYNVKPEYINEAINSVLNQTYKNIEIIIVNDGSTNLETLDFLKTINNERIKVINQDNKGLGGARNTGINHASGDYIGFLDADDWLDENFYEILIDLCEKNNADIACGTLTRATENKLIPMDNFKNVVLCNFSEKMQMITNGSLCSKLFKKSLFDNIRFMEHVYWEDNPVLVELLLKSNKIAFTNLVKYLYRENLNSICLNSDPIKEEKRKADRLFILEQISNLHYKTPEDKEATMNAFGIILVPCQGYLEDAEYRKKANAILGKNYDKYLKKVAINKFKENIFSLKNSIGRLYKVITIFGIKIWIKRF